jgi:D-proline reductase (dithiol) PrdB
MEMQQFKNRALARLITFFPEMGHRLVAAHKPMAFDKIPWVPVKKPLNKSKFALITTAGIHHRSQSPFDMHDPFGDPTYRVLESDTIMTDYTITHDYYDHRDADQDPNIILPIHRFQELKAAGVIGGLSSSHYGFMGHIKGHHIDELMEKKMPKVIAMLFDSDVDAVLLTPG